MDQAPLPMRMAAVFLNFGLTRQVTKHIMGSENIRRRKV